MLVFLIAASNTIRLVFFRNVVYVDVGDNLPGAVNSLRNGQTLQIGVGVFSITPSNNTGSGEPPAPMRIIGKTNISIRGSGPGTMLVGANAGVMLCISNCQNVVVESITFDEQWSGYTSNGINGISGMIVTAGTNNTVAIKSCIFQNSPIFGVLTCYRSGLIDKLNNFTMQDCVGSNLGTTNLPQIGASDGGLIAGAGDNFTISRCQSRDSIRFFEIFNLAAAPSTNIAVSDITVEGNDNAFVSAATVTQLRISNMGIKGGNTYPSASFVAAGTIGYQSGIYMQGGIANVQLENIQATGIKGRPFELANSSGTISNVSLRNFNFSDCGIPGIINGGIMWNDPAGNGVIQSIFISGGTIANNVFQAIDVQGGRDVIIDGVNIFDAVSGGGFDAIRITHGFDLTTNIVVRNCFIKNFLPSRADYGIGVTANAMNVRLIENIITNMVVGAINDLGASTTVIGEPFTYSVTTNLASLAAGASTTVFVPAPLARLNWRADVMVPGDFFGVTGGSDIAVTSYCTNFNVTVRIINNGAGAFDPPSALIKATVRAVGAY